MQSNSASQIIQSERAFSVLVGTLVIGFLTIPFYAAQTPNFGQFASVVGVAVTVAFSALLAGGLLGFLFGIPRTLQQDESQLAQKSGQNSATSNDLCSQHEFGTNFRLAHENFSRRWAYPNFNHSGSLG